MFLRSKSATIRHLLSLFLVVFIFSCSEKKKKLNEVNLSKFFSSNEVNYLTKIHSSFTDIICSLNDNNISNLDCYKNFCEEIKNTQTKGDLHIELSEEIAAITINETFHNEIWSYGKLWRNNTDTIKYISYNPKGKYMGFLKTLGKEYSLIKKYNNSFKNAGDISPSMLSNVLMYYEQLDLNDERIQLFIAIHYITVYKQELSKK